MEQNPENRAAFSSTAPQILLVLALIIAALTGLSLIASAAGGALLVALLIAAGCISYRDRYLRKELMRVVSAKERETALARDLLQTTLSSIGDAVIATDADGKVTFLNAVAQQLTGWTQQEAAGVHLDQVFQIVSGSERVAVESVAFRVLRDGKAVELATDTILLGKDGRECSIEDSASPIRDGDGKVAGVVLVFRDITTRKVGEMALEESEDRFRSTFASAPIGMVITDLEGRFIRSNDAYCQITGYAASELPSIRFLSLTHPGEADFNRELFRKLLANELPSYVIEKRILSKSGVPVWVRASATLLREYSGRATQVMGIVENIDARKQAEAMLTAKARLDALGADVGKALTQTDAMQDSLKLCAEAMVRHLDAAFARIWTMNEAEDTLELQASAGMYTHMDGPHARVPVGAYKIGLIAQERRPHLTNDVPNDPRVSDKEWARAKGMISFAGYPLLIGQRVVGVLGMFARQPLPAETLDELGSVADSIAIGIQRKRSEADLLAALEREKEVRVEIEISAKSLSRSNEDLQHFVNAASHDLRSPLRTVNSMATLLARRYGSQLDGSAHELIGFITGGATRMDSLLSDLLTFSAASHAEPATEPVKAEEAVGEALDNLRAAIEESGAVVTLDQLPVLMVHKTHLLQIFQNLIGNAIKYRSSEPPRIGITAIQREAGWAISVCDNGMGIDPQYKGEVFAAFKRLHGSEYPGNGIGLATCKRIVEGYGGEIWVESKAGCGSTFSFSLPNA